MGCTANYSHCMTQLHLLTWSQPCSPAVGLRPAAWERRQTGRDQGQSWEWREKKFDHSPRAANLLLGKWRSPFRSRYLLHYVAKSHPFLGLGVAASWHYSGSQSPDALALEPVSYLLSQWSLVTISGAGQVGKLRPRACRKPLKAYGKLRESWMWPSPIPELCRLLCLPSPRAQC